MTRKIQILRLDLPKLKDLLEVIGPRAISEQSFCQSATIGKMNAAAGNASAQKRLTLIIENVSVRMDFIFILVKSINPV